MIIYSKLLKIVLTFSQQNKLLPKVSKTHGTRMAKMFIPHSLPVRENQNSTGNKLS